jgi:hypothetical protein
LLDVQLAPADLSIYDTSTEKTSITIKPRCKNPVDRALEKQLDYLKLAYLKESCRPFAAKGNAKHWSHLDYLARLIAGEAAAPSWRKTKPISCG